MGDGWELRLVKKTNEEGTEKEWDWYQVCEIKEGSTDFRSVRIESDSVENIRAILMQAIKALDKPVIDLVRTN